MHVTDVAEASWLSITSQYESNVEKGAFVLLAFTCLVYVNVHTHTHTSHYSSIPCIPETAAIFSGALQTSGQP